MNSQSTYELVQTAGQAIQYAKSVRDRNILFHDWSNETIVVEMVKRAAAGELYFHSAGGSDMGLALVSVGVDSVRIDNIVVEGRKSLEWLIKQWYAKFPTHWFTGNHLKRKEIRYKGDDLRRVLTLIYKLHGRTQIR